MGKKYVIILSLLFILSCSRKHLPQAAGFNKTNPPVRKINLAKPVSNGPLPKTLSVNDRIASKAVDGRLYFDLDGRRYWKNYKDGKYYLFNKIMYEDPAFKPGYK